MLCDFEILDFQKTGAFPQQEVFGIWEYMKEPLVCGHRHVHGITFITTQSHAPQEGGRQFLSISYTQALPTDTERIIHPGERMDDFEDPRLCARPETTLESSARSPTRPL